MSRKMTRRQFLAATATATAGLALAACGPAPTTAPATSAPAATVAPPPAATATSAPAAVVPGPTAAPQIGKVTTLRGANARQYDDLNPLGVIGVVNADIYKRVFSSLVQFDTQLNIKGDLAQDWSRSADGKTWTFKLRPGIKWHDGTPFTSKDVRFTLSRMAHPDVHAYSAYVTDAIVGSDEVKAKSADMISGITTPDDNTVVINLKVPTSFFLAGMTKAWIIPSHLLASTSAVDLPKHPMWSGLMIGTGMYKMTAYTPKQVIEFDSYPAWHLGKPKIDHWIWQIIPARDTQLLAMEKGEIDYINFGGGTKDELARYKANSNLFFKESFEPKVDMFALQNARFADVRVRQAMAYAVDMNALVQAVGGPEVYKVQDYFFMNPWITDTAIKWTDVYKYDPKKARSLLEDAKWDFSKEVSFITKGDKTPPPDALLLQEQLQAIGMKVTIKIVDTVSPYLYQSLDFDIANTGNVYDDPYVNAVVFTCKSSGKNGTSLTQYCNTSFDKLLEADAIAPDQAARAVVYKQLQALLVNEAAAIPKPYAPNRALFNKRVKVPTWAWYVWDESWNWEIAAG